MQLKNLLEAHGQDYNTLQENNGTATDRTHSLSVIDTETNLKKLFSMPELKGPFSDELKNGIRARIDEVLLQESGVRSQYKCGLGKRLASGSPASTPSKCVY